MKIKSKEIIALKRKLKLAGIEGLALDIDDTLSMTKESLFEELSKKLDNPEKLTGREMAKKYRHTDNVPYWETDKIESTIKDIYEVSEFHENLSLIENSNKIVQKINKSVPIMAYITVRSIVILNGTEKWLKQNNFPKSTIIARPKNVDRFMGNKWKAKVLEYLYPQILGIVDDNPGLTKFFSKKYKGTVFLYDHVDAERKDIKVIPCEDWETVAKKVKECKL